MFPFICRKSNSCRETASGIKNNFLNWIEFSAKGTRWNALVIIVSFSLACTLCLHGNMLLYRWLILYVFAQICVTASRHRVLQHPFICTMLATSLLTALAVFWDVAMESVQNKNISTSYFWLCYMCSLCSA